jgi:hypothetical protein
MTRTAVVNYTIEVQPGPVYTMGKLIIQNGADDLRAAMLAAWKMPAGAVFNASAIQTYYSSQGNTRAGTNLCLRHLQIRADEKHRYPHRRCDAARGKTGLSTASSSTRCASIATCSGPSIAIVSVSGLIEALARNGWISSI